MPQGQLTARTIRENDGVYRGISVFGTDSATARRLSLEDPAVKAGRLEIEMLPWFTAWGVMPPRANVKEAGL